jgi:hypothetical protein
MLEPLIGSVEWLVGKELNGGELQAKSHHRFTRRRSGFNHMGYSQGPALNGDAKDLKEPRRAV